MAADSKVIDAEFVEVTNQTDAPFRGSVAQATAVTARTAADAFEGAGMNSVATRARKVADVADAAQATYDAVMPAVTAVGSLIKKLEDMNVLTYSKRPPMRKPQ